MTEQSSARLRALLVEDEALIAMLMEDMLSDFACDVVAIAGTVEAAVSLARSGSFDLAFVDVNLRGVPAYPVAQALRERGIPFAFVTGYGAAGADLVRAGEPVLQKPFRSGELEAILHRLQCQAC